MNPEKVVFGFFILLAATLNFGFFIGDIANPELHNVYELFAALVVSLIATALKFGDRTQIGAVHLSTSLVADLRTGRNFTLDTIRKIEAFMREERARRAERARTVDFAVEAA